MSAQQDSVALDWIKGEVKETLLQAQQALDVVAESPDDAISMRECLTAIHQVHGTLKMVELPGGVQFASEMEELAQALMNDNVPDKGQAQEVLMQGILQLPGYLDLVQKEHAEAIGFIRGVVNNLRIARGVEPLAGDEESVELKLNLEMINAAPSQAANKNFATSGGESAVRKLRQRYQRSLLELLKNQKQKDNLALLTKIFSMLAKITNGSPVNHLSQLTITVFEALSNESIKLDVNLGSLLKRIDPVLKHLVEEGEQGLSAPVPEVLLAGLMQIVMNDAAETPRVNAVKKKYLVQAYGEPREQESIILGPDRDTMSVVAKVLLEELVLLKDKLDLYVRASTKNPDDLQALIPSLEQLADSMSVIGIDHVQGIVREQLDQLKSALAKSGEAPETLLIDMASAFIEVEGIISPMVLADGSEMQSEAIGSLSGAAESVITEIRNGLSQCKDGVIEFISTDWDRSKIESIPQKLIDLRGSLSIINQDRPARVLLACARYLSKSILQNPSPPALEEMDYLADALTSIDYYFEKYLDSSAEPYIQMLEVAESSIAKLGYPVEGIDAAYEEDRQQEVEEDSPELLEEVEEGEEIGAVEEVQEAVAEEVATTDQEEAVTEAAATQEADETAELPESVEPLEQEEPLLEATEEQVASADALAEDISVEPAEVEVSAETLPEEETEDKQAAEEDSVIELDTEAEEYVAEEIEYESSPAQESLDEEPLSGGTIPADADSTLQEEEIAPETPFVVEGESELPIEELVVEEISETPGDRSEVTEAEFEIEEVDYDDELVSTDSDSQPAAVGQQVVEGDAETGEEQEPEQEDSLIDEEIIEIFVEEAAEVIDTINEFYPVWRVNSADQEALTSIRRAFHTLKGSGRMVGATVVGELAWAVENMLNKVLEQLIGVGPELLRLMDQVLERIPAAIKAFEEKKQHAVDLSDLQDFADRIARGESVSISSAAAEEVAAEPASVEVEEIEEVEEIPADEMFVEEIFEDNELFGEEEDLVTLEPEELDSELLEIFESEAATHLMTLREFVERAERGPVSFTPAVRAALHTLKGSASMAEISSITTLAIPLDRFTSQLFDRHIKTDPRITALLRQAVDLVSDVLLNLSAMATITLEGTEDFLSELTALRTELIGDEETEHVEKPAALPVFSFEGIDALLDSEEILEAWETEGLSRLVAELDLIVERAEGSSRKGLHELASSLRLSYGPLSISRRPSDLVMVALNRAHNHLVEMLDEVAAGQLETVNESILSSLAKLSDLDEDDLSSSEPIHFVQEAWTLLNNIDSTVQTWKEDIYNSLELEKLHGYFSTLSGLAEEINERVMVELCERVIALCTALKNGDLAAEDSDPGLLDSCHQQLVDFLGVIQRSEELLPNEKLVRELEQRVELESSPPETPKPISEETIEIPVALEASVPVEEETSTEEVDEEILSIFLEEAEELIESIDQSILQWNSQKGDSVPLKNLLRYLHTLKGGARLAGLSSLGEYAHNFETYLIDAQQGKIEINDLLFTELNKRQDEINRRVEIYQRMASGKATESERASVARAPAETDRAEVESQPVADSVPDEQEQSLAKTAAPQEVVRVSAELLDQLLGMASEASITRGLIEQQINDFGGAIDELELTAARVRDQVRRLEIETESRETVFRARVQEGDAEFDELEMDQYTHLQEISRSLAEGVSDMLDLKETLKNKSRDTELLLQQQARLGNELQEGLTRTKMVPFSRTIPRLRRIVRQVSDELGKKIRFDAFNVEGELDRNVLEKIVAPLEHMLRNAVDHGIESAEARKQANKPLEGRITLRLYRESGYFVLHISDDGGGIDVNKVRKKAVERGLIAPDARLTNQEIMSFIMKAGFSTAEQLTQISGRGVGLDVVDSEIRQLGGDVTIESVLGKGTDFLIRIPFTVAITRALMVVVAEEIYAIPLNSIEGIVRVSPYELEAYYQPDAPRFEYASQTYRLVYMGNALENTGNPNLQGQVSLLSVILARSGENAVAFQVDRVIGSREVVVKSLGPQFNEVTGVSGASILGDGSVVVILDLMALVRASSEAEIEPEVIEEPEVETIERVRTVMIVDDSVTVRKVTSRLIERQGWDVMLAKDGIDALEQLQDKRPDVMLLDIEMPRMDGFEVLRSVRRDEALKDLPIIMITSRTGEKHKTQAAELGVNRYLGKPFQENMLLDTIEEVILENRG